MTGAGAPGEGGLAGLHVVVGICGGIAAYKACELVRLLVKDGAGVDAVLTRGGARFVGRAALEGITGRPCRTGVWEAVHSTPHLTLAEADAVVVYPATAHLLARAAHGLADDLLTTILVATAGPVMMAPAMHSGMWEHPAVQDNVRTLQGRGVVLIGPVEGDLMGGDSGPGRAVEPEAVVRRLRTVIARPLSGRTVVVTAGGTREPLDPVRFLSNRSSGKMGFAVAAEAARRGATVHLVAAPTLLPTPAGTTRHDVVTARQMQEAVAGLAGDADAVIMAAAVADFRPADPSARKLKKGDGPPQVVLEPNPDILAGLATARDGDHPVLVGFAAETDDAERNARRKLASKGVDLLVLNDVSAQDAGFEVDTNRVVLFGRDGRRVEVPLASKGEVAARLIDEVAGLLR